MNFIELALAISLGLVVGSVACTGLYIIIMVKFGKKITEWFMNLYE